MQKTQTFLASLFSFFSGKREVEAKRVSTAVRKSFPLSVLTPDSALAFDRKNINLFVAFFYTLE